MIEVLAEVLVDDSYCQRSTQKVGVGSVPVPDHELQPIRFVGQRPGRPEPGPVILVFLLCHKINPGSPRTVQGEPGEERCSFSG
jgi:hypothetical protein